MELEKLKEALCVAQSMHDLSNKMEEVYLEDGTILISRADIDEQKKHQLELISILNERIDHLSSLDK